MSYFPTIACGNCVYYALWHKFPPTNSWVVLIPLWFLTLSAARTFGRTSIKGIPKLYIALPLVIAVLYFAPGMIGPPLGFWIPICCLIGTWAGLHAKGVTLRKHVKVVTVCFTVALLAFGAGDYHQYNEMPQPEKDKLIPVWEAMPEPQPKAG